MLLFKRSVLPILLCSAFFCSPVFGESFTVQDIYLGGLQSLPEENVIPLLSLKVGTTLDQDQSDVLIHRLFKSGYFDDIQLFRGEHDALKLSFVERPVIGSIHFSGNEMIKKDDVQKVLTGAHLTAGNTLNPQVLKQVADSLRREYHARGRYAVRIEITTESLPRNRVDIQIKIKEGYTAKIARIQFTGNQVFHEAELGNTFTLSVPTFFSFLTSNDLFSDLKFQESIQNLSNFYLDRGYLDFRILSHQVSLNTELSEVYLILNLTEGEQYRVSELRFEGELAEDFNQAHYQHLIRKGDIFSKKQVMEIAEAITQHLGNLGFAFAQVNPVPTLDPEKREVLMTYYVNPGQKVLVRNVEFLGNTETRDQVFRQQLTYVEGGLYSYQKLQDSKIRFQRMPFLGGVQDEVVPVPGSADLVDVKYHLTEKSANQISGSLGYSELNKLFFQLGFNMPNVFGTGNIFNINTMLSRPEKTLNVSYTQPYFTREGVEQSIDFYITNLDNSKRDLASYSVNNYGMTLGYAIPISLNDFFNINVGYDHSRLVRAGTTISTTVNDFIDHYGDEYQTYTTGFGWSRLTTNQAYFPTEGVDARVHANIAIPGSDLTWYKLGAHSKWYFPLWFDQSAFAISGNAQYGNGYGDVSELPFFKNYYGGGWGSVRGFSEGSLGPHDRVCQIGDPTQCTRGNALGGNLSLSLNFNLYLPVFFVKDSDRQRIVLFADMGNVYDTYSVQTTFDNDPETTPSFKNLRYSMGFGYIWASPMGNIGFSFSKSFNVKEGDDPNVFQFTIHRSL